jgi:hypothetical protein
MPSPIRKITFLGFANPSIVREGDEAASFAGVHELTITRKRTASESENRLPDSRKLFAGEGFDGSFKFERK